MKVLIFSHESDLDGLYSASIGLMRFPQAKLIFLANNEGFIDKISHFVNSWLNPKVQGLIIISDISLNDNSINKCKEEFEGYVQQKWNIIWLDHHPWSDNAISNISKFCELILDTTNEKCAADLMYQKFLLGNMTASSLANMAHTMDFFKKDQFLTPVSEIITYYKTFYNYYDKLNSLAMKSSQGVLWDVEMQEDYNIYTKLRDQAKTQVLDSISIEQMDGLKIAYVPLSPYIQTSLFSEIVFDKKNSDLAIFYDNMGKISIRRNNNTISCRRIALHFPQGGGHDFAAGAFVKQDKFDLEELKKSVNTAIRNSV